MLALSLRLEAACPVGEEGERGCKGLSDNLARLVGEEKRRVDGDVTDGERVAVGTELGIQGLEMVEDCLLGTLHLGKVAARKGEVNKRGRSIFHIVILIYGETKSFACSERCRLCENAFTY